jgi:hypothetical protein
VRYRNLDFTYLLLVYDLTNKNNIFLIYGDEDDDDDDDDDDENI